MAGDYTWIVQQNIQCDKEDDVCGQLHLIFGDACFRLAKQNTDPVKHYACAVSGLEKGIDLIKTWKTGEADLNRPRSYANLSESLRAQQDRTRGIQADQITQHLLETAQRFLVVEPGNPMAIYYHSVARYAQMRRDLIRGENPESLCQRLNAIHSDLEAAMPQARGTDYEASLTQLQSDILAAKRTVTDCT